MNIKFSIIEKCTLVIMLLAFGCMQNRIGHAHIGIYDVTTYGATPNNSLDDDYNAIQNAINAAAVTGGEVYLPSGTYDIWNRPMGLIVKSNITIRGSGWKSTTIMVRGSVETYSAFSTSNPMGYADVTHLTIEDLGIVGFDKSKPNVGGAIQLLGGEFIHLRRLYIEGFQYGVNLRGGIRNTHIDLCHFEQGQSTPYNQPLAGIVLHNDGNGINHQITIQRSQFNYGLETVGILDFGGKSHHINENNFNGLSHAIYMAGTQASSIKGNRIESTFDTNIVLTDRNIWGVNVGPNSSIVIQNNHISTATGQIGINFDYLNSATGSPIIITGNQIISTPSTLNYSLTGLTNVHTLVTSGNYQQNYAGLYNANAKAINHISLELTGIDATTIKSSSLDASTIRTSSLLQANGMLGLNVAATKTTAYTAGTDIVIPCNPSGGGFTVTLPTPNAAMKGRIYIIKNTTSSTNPITIQSSNSTIDGSSNVQITSARGHIRVFTDGSVWFRF
jgi:hypothetical protein